ncbi:MAG: hydratase [Eubacteriales bacterium]
MVKLIKHGVFYENGRFSDGSCVPAEAARKNTMAYSILTAHNHSGNDENFKIKFDAMASHDITYVGIIQTARASGLTKFPIPYVLTNCHNSLCAVGGTINEDDHLFGLSAAKKYGGIFVPAHQSVIHSYMRECFAGCGKMILGSDSHTRYGALGTLAIGEGGPELVKQLLCRTYDIPRPEVIAVHLTGKVRPGVGPHDVALALVGATFPGGFVKNKILEFVGDGISGLSMDFRNGVDVMTTETTCLSSIWMTDEKTEEFLTLHGRAYDYKPLAPKGVAYYDGLVEIDLSTVEPMIALPFHPSNAYTIRDFLANAPTYLKKVEETAEKELGVKLDLRSKFRDGKFYVDQGVIAGCAGGSYENLCAAADILSGGSVGAGGFGLSVYPASQPTLLGLLRTGRASTLAEAGAILRTAFCGPCFGAGDVPANGGLSIRHSTRNFPNREGSKPGEGQIAAVALMDSRSIAATAKMGGVLTPATDLEVEYTAPDYHYDDTVYKNRVYNGFGRANPEEKLVFGPNIADWPDFPAAPDTCLLKVASVLEDPVTTTDELIPSGETSSYRSNPERLSSFALSRRDPSYVPTAKEIRTLESERRAGKAPDALSEVYEKIAPYTDTPKEEILLGTLIYAVKPGDGSAREQAASCQRVLGGVANIAIEYATKRYRSNLINWGMLPFTVPEDPHLETGDYILVTGVRDLLLSGASDTVAHVIGKDGSVRELTLSLGNLSPEERQIIADGCLINHYRVGM